MCLRLCDLGCNILESLETLLGSMAGLLGSWDALFVNFTRLLGHCENFRSLEGVWGPWEEFSGTCGPWEDFLNHFW